MGKEAIWWGGLVGELINSGTNKNFKIAGLGGPLASALAASNHSLPRYRVAPTKAPMWIDQQSKVSLLPSMATSSFMRDIESQSARVFPVGSEAMPSND
jgi:hypothetical protein